MKKKRVNQEYLIQQIVAKTTMNRAQAERVINAFKAAITESLRKGEEVRLAGFGVFYISRLRARKGYSGFGEEEIRIPSHKVVRLRNGKSLKVAINKTARIK